MKEDLRRARYEQSGETESESSKLESDLTKSLEQA